MISFCCAELGMSLEEAYDTTWAEYCIRSHGYHRLQQKEWEKVRVMAWHSLIAPNADPKKLPKSMQKFMPLEDKVRPVNVGHELFFQLEREYLEQKERAKRER